MRLKLVLFVPPEKANDIRKVLANWHTIAGNIGAYTHCSTSSPSTGYWKEKGDEQLKSAAEVRIETVLTVKHRKNMVKLLADLRAVHPYREMGYDLYKLLDVDERLDVINDSPIVHQFQEIYQMQCQTVDADTASRIAEIERQLGSTVERAWMSKK